MVMFFIGCKSGDNTKNDTANTGTETITNSQTSLITNSVFAPENLFGIWTTDPSAPHADFELTKDSFYLVDYDGDGNFPYEIKDNKIKIYYPENQIHRGLIKKAENDTLIIYWASGEFITYTRFPQ
jgi:hypothetical protein